MSLPLSDLLGMYLLRITSQYENDLTQLLNNLVLRSADPVDHLELIMAHTRCAVADQIAKDIYKIIDISNLGE